MRMDKPESYVHHSVPDLFALQYWALGCYSACWCGRRNWEKQVLPATGESVP